MPFTITTKNVLQFTWRRRTVDSVKEKLKSKFLKNIEHDLFTRGQMAAYMNSDQWLNQRQMEINVFLFWLFHKRNGKHCSCATMELWMHLGGLPSTQEARVAQGDFYASFVLSNLSRASTTPSFTMTMTKSLCLEERPAITSKYFICSDFLVESIVIRKLCTYQCNAGGGGGRA